MDSFFVSMVGYSNTCTVLQQTKQGLETSHCMYHTHYGLLPCPPMEMILRTCMVFYIVLPYCNQPDATSALQAHRALRRLVVAGTRTELEQVPTACTYLHTCMRIPPHEHARTSARACTYLRTCTCVPPHVHTCTSARVCTYLHTACTSAHMKCQKQSITTFHKKTCHAYKNSVTHKMNE